TVGRLIPKGEKIRFYVVPTEIAKDDPINFWGIGGAVGLQNLSNKIVKDINTGLELGRFDNDGINFMATRDIPTGSRIRINAEEPTLNLSSIFVEGASFSINEGFYVGEKLIDSTNIGLSTPAQNSQAGATIYTTELDKNNRPVIFNIATVYGYYDLSIYKKDLSFINTPLDPYNKNDIKALIDFEISEFNKLKAMDKKKPFYHAELRFKSEYRETLTESINKQVNDDIDSAIRDLNYAKEDADEYSSFSFHLIKETLMRGLEFRRGICINNNILYNSFKTRKDATIQFVIGTKSGSQNDLTFLKNIPKEYFMNSNNVGVAFRKDLDKVLSNGAQLQIGKLQTPKDVRIKVSENGKVAVISIDIDLDVNFTSVAVGYFKIPVPSNVSFFDSNNKPNLQYEEFNGSEFSMTDGASVLGQEFNDKEWEDINKYPDHDWQFRSYDLLKNQFIRADRIITTTRKTNLDGELVGTTPIPFNKRRVPSEDLEVGKERLKQKGEEGAKRYDGTIVKQPKDEIIEYGVRKTVVKTETKDIPFKEIRRPANDLEEGKTRVVQEGQVGKQTRKSTTVVNSETGKTISGPTYTDWTTTTKAKDKIIEYGVRKTV
ncbi:MAG: G5 domain-containing protein, partial [Finegoldia magna]|nr:G5 domain-containing protein [Finegoldia magna]